MSVTNKQVARMWVGIFVAIIVLSYPLGWLYLHYWWAMTFLATAVAVAFIILARRILKQERR